MNPIFNFNIIADFTITYGENLMEIIGIINLIGTVAIVVAVFSIFKEVREYNKTKRQEKKILKGDTFMKVIFEALSGSEIQVGTDETGSIYLIVKSKDGEVKSTLETWQSKFLLSALQQAIEEQARAKNKE